MRVASRRARAARRRAAACSRAPERPSTTSRTGCRRAVPTASSATTAPASTRGCSPPAARTAGRCIRIATPEHPLQQRIAELHRRRGDCGRRLRRPDVRDDARRVRRAAHAHARRGFAPPCARGPSSSARRPTPLDTDLMRLRDGWIAKGGAEGLFCAAHDDGRGIALKAEDGAYRAIGPALGAGARDRRAARGTGAQQSRRGRRRQ